MTNTILDVSINIEIQPRAPIIVSVDTHADTHHVALINEYGKRLSDKKFVATEEGYRDIVRISPRLASPLPSALKEPEAMARA